MINSILGGKYYITELVGSGGMANVYKARVIGTDEVVAIKILKEEFARDREFVRRFRSEAQAVLYLSHDNIVRLVDVGKEDDTNYIVLEFVEGKTLKQMIREKGRLDEQEAIQIAMQLCDALSHAHENKIIHRDIKPQNILMDESGRARIADFGIARRADASTMTFTGSNILGSVHYLSPEQAKGSPVDQKSDIYSLGIVLYEMVTGRVPFDSENTLSVAIMHLQEEIAAPLTHNENLGKALNDIILKATQKDKRRRYDSALEMKRDLLRALREPDGAFVVMDERNTLRIKRRRSSSFVNILRLALGMIVILGLLVTLFIMGRTAIERSRSETAVYIPSLVDKSYDEAVADAQSRGFVVQERTRGPSDYPEGRVYAQEPRSGSKGKEGDVIYVDVSTGASTLYAPMLEGATLEEARRTIEEWKLVVGSVEYEYSDQPEDTVIRQVPEADTPMVEGAAIDLYVSGIEGERDIVPSMVDKSIEDALIDAEGNGFAKVLVFPAKDVPEGTPVGRVVSQNPTGGKAVMPGRTIEVEVVMDEAAPFAADTAYNVDVVRKNSEVMIVLLRGIAEYVVFQETMSDGRQTIPLTILSQTEDPAEVIIYVDGEETRRETVTFGPRSNGNGGSE